jgi:hypothetical protein
MFTPPAARRTDPRRLRRDHRLVVDAEIAAADNPSRPAAGPRADAVLLCRTYLVAGPLADATRCVLGRWSGWPKRYRSTFRCRRRPGL